MRTTSISNRVAARSSGKRNTTGSAAVVVGGMVAGKSVKFATILVPVDFSAFSEAAFEYALRLAEVFDSRVRLLHVVEENAMPDFESLPLALHRNVTIAMAKRKLVEFAQKGSHPLITVSPEVRAGEPWEEIVRLAEKEKADLIIIPTHGRTGLKKVLMGSVAERVIRHASCPVLVLRGGQVDLFVTRKTDQGKTEVKL